jgi:hypothetical protein
VELIVPPDLEEPLPSLGPQVVQFLKERAVHGPGDLKGQPLNLDEDWEYWLWRAYEVWPMGHPKAGRRRFERCIASVRKGAAKTEQMAFVAFVELHYEAPVRFNGFNKDGTLKQGRPVVDPFMPLLANTEKQVSDLAYGALKVICEECPDADRFDATLDRIVRIGDNGKADGTCKPVASAPDSNDGGRTTWQGYDETHRLWLPNHKEAIQTMESNLGKRYAQDPWSMSTTTAGEPGKQSQAEDDHFEAEATARGEVERPSMFYFHRQASDRWNMDDFQERCQAIIEASGPQLAERTDIESIASRWDRPKADKTYLERVWTNRWTQQGAQAFDITKWRDELGRDAVIPPRAYVTIGFDGARMHDATAFVVTDVKTGLQQLEGLWEKALDDPDDWEVDELEVNEKRKELFKRFRVLKLYADPPYWNYTVGDWAAHHPDVVEEFWTNQKRRIHKANEAFGDAIASGSVGFSAQHEHADDLSRHIGNAGRRDTNLTADDETGRKVWILTKLHPERKMDACMAAVLSWQARMDMLGKVPKAKKRVFRQIR